MKIPFDIKFRPQIESGEYKVFAHEHEEQEARIVCWDNKGEYPIVALVDNEPEKFDIHGRVPGGNRGGEFSLFIVTPEEEMTEFEEAVGAEIFDPPFNAEQVKVIKEESAKLLVFARNEIVKSGYAIIEGEHYLEEWRKNYERGKAEALRGLPMWIDDGLPMGSAAIDISGLCGFDFIRRRGRLLRISGLEELPGFKE